jgi:hypothetical protein
MPGPDPIADFRHQHGDALQTIKLNRFEVAGELRKEFANQELPPGAVPAREALLVEYESLHDEVIEDLTMDSLDPELVFKRAARSLERVESFRFLTDNLFEAVKHDESFNDTIKNYRHLSLFPSPTGGSALPDDKRNSPWILNRFVGGFLKKLRKGLKKLALALIELLINALKVIPRFEEIEITPSVGFAGPFPTVSFDIALKAKGIAVHELFETLMGSLDG